MEGWGICKTTPFSLTFGPQYIGFARLTRSRALAAFILRPRQVGWGRSPVLNAEYSSLLDDTSMDLGHPEDVVVRIGCIAGVSPPYEGCDS